MYIDMNINNVINIQIDTNGVSTSTTNIGLLITSNGNSSCQRRYKTDTKKVTHLDQGCKLSITAGKMKHKNIFYIISCPVHRFHHN